jgi:hypothetical protein
MFASETEALLAPNITGRPVKVLTTLRSAILIPIVGLIRAAFNSTVGLVAAPTTANLVTAPAPTPNTKLYVRAKPISSLFTALASLNLVIASLMARPLARLRALEPSVDIPMASSDNTFNPSQVVTANACLAKPTVAIYGATDIDRSGTLGQKSINLGSTFACAPCMQRSCTLPGADQTKPPCYKEITPKIVWANLTGLLKEAQL